MDFKKELETTKNPVIQYVGSKLQERAEQDASFKSTLEKQNKSLEECYEYIRGELYKTAFNDKKGKVAFDPDNDKLVNMAVHYYDEDDIVVSGLPKGVKTVEQVGEKTTQPIAKEIKQTNPHKKVKKQDIVEGQVSLF